VPFGHVRPNTCRLSAAGAGYSCALALLIFFCGSKTLQNAIAEGETRTISLHHIHTNEDITITYKRDGRYDEAALDKLNWLLRDWRRNKVIRMDPQLIDLVWEVQRETGPNHPIWVVCGYRSPETNAMLRRRSSGVARFSQHMLGHAMDFYIPGVPLEDLRVIGLRLQRGGVGFYPSSGSPFVHMDTGGVRMWPRMTRDALLRVFPNGRTAYIPSDGRPLPGYELALADIRKHGKDLPAAIEMARDEHQGVKALSEMFAKTEQTEEDDPDEAADMTAAAAPVVSPTDTPSENALAAALERVAARKRETAAKVANATDKPALYHTASLQETAASEAPQRVAGLTPNQVIVARGYWQGLPDGQVAAQPASTPSASAPSRKATVSTFPDITSAFKAFAGATRDRVPTDLALAYAAQPEPNVAVLPPAPTSGPTSQPTKATQPKETQSRLPVPSPPVGTTIAMKRDADQATSTIVAPPLSPSALSAPSAEPDNPWLRALLLSPNIGSYLTTLMLGAEDFRSLAALVEQPKSSVMMTFTSEPNPSMTAERFSGSAIVFVPTITYQMHTTALR
jgi:uncharacterized protein YcbK (DUF882 family)/DNA-binding NarL/FixJ family response regulator